jgi:hypothetical protein
MNKSKCNVKASGRRFDILRGFDESSERNETTRLWSRTKCEAQQCKSILYQSLCLEIAIE